MGQRSILRSVQNSDDGGSIEMSMNNDLKTNADLNQRQGASTGMAIATPNEFEIEEGESCDQSPEPYHKMISLVPEYEPW
mmetsp:Transcript_41024/g.53777  ORF Transcript_41024/g.53777 Transcript_41024/m.53777 type:complete len:80 (-) Transcript_41024:710-949(-)|eukprot:CAMPEP_0185574958 /NCGR_PEP_ID=MMETSP0434-20130131/6285_1 /TAXON_ID=626734 ORGANISM="Favella taraikaensis, Strain Fe Narragansett Bay" /NCGR_SAMPLE_ID=MMETSP0434 /ASSEMBLY_ACC=CAM_ASM_000379 /LENGTH=79 /DNA_ID=CAMNT_0028191699 /DNA_START=957 /DNA_END=1196 /DNA_ORIENTATION=+